jgi:hypothetical protein
VTDRQREIDRLEADVDRLEAELREYRELADRLLGDRRDLEDQLAYAERMMLKSKR